MAMEEAMTNMMQRLAAIEQQTQQPEQQRQQERQQLQQTNQQQLQQLQEEVNRLRAAAGAGVATAPVEAARRQLVDTRG
eukprot:3748315-Amphidinium_carterae.1